MRTLENKLHSLAYFSRNSITESGGDLKLEIGRILTVARERNRVAGVTGALMFSGGCFGQVLEGPLKSVEEIFESILQDVRHNNITVLSLKQLESRRYANWSMAFAGLPKLGVVPMDIAGLLNSPDQIEPGPAEDNLVTMLSKLIAKHEAA